METIGEVEEYAQSNVSFRSRVSWLRSFFCEIEKNSAKSMDLERK
jgi:hypothetical protein